MADWVSEAFTNRVGLELHEKLVDIGNRFAGSEGEQRGAEAVRDALDKAGARNAQLSEFDIQGWTRGSSEVTAGGESFDCIALPRSPSGNIESELVDLGHGLPRDFENNDIENKAVIVDTDVPEWYDRFIHRREKYYYAVEHGANAFLFRNHVEGGLPPTGSVGTPDEPIGGIPAVGVSKEAGSRISRRFEGKPISVSVEADIHDATSQNIHAVIGPETEEEVLVTSHADAHDISEGALDNGAGTAIAVQTAAALAQREEDLETRVRFVAFGSEEVGLVGSSHYVDNHDLDNIRAVLNNDGSGRARDLQIVTHHFSPFSTAAQRVQDRLNSPIHVVPRLRPHSDHWPFVQQGVPGAQLRSVTDDQGRGWGHTEADTYDKVDSRDIRMHAMLGAGLAVELAREDTEVSHKEHTEIAERLEAENLAKGMKIIGDWPY